jgi:hypothetical protein
VVVLVNSDDEGGEPRPANLLPNPDCKADPKPPRNSEEEEPKPLRRIHELQESRG